MISCIQNPNACQLYIVPNLVRDGVIDSFLADLQTSAEPSRCLANDACSTWWTGNHNPVHFSANPGPDALPEVRAREAPVC